MLYPTGYPVTVESNPHLGAFAALYLRAEHQHPPLAHRVNADQVGAPGGLTSLTR